MTFLAALLLPAGCRLDPGGPVESDQGTLVLSFRLGSLFLQTLAPNIPMQIATIDIAGDGPDPYAFSYPGIAPAGLELSGLALGTWTFTVDARNIDGTIIGHGEKTVTLAAGPPLAVLIDILPLSGTGTLTLTFQWDKKLHSGVSVSGALLSMSSGQNLNLTFVPSPSLNQATYGNPAVPAGYYLLTLQASDSVGKFWGIAEAVRIVAGQDTPGSWNIKY